MHRFGWLAFLVLMTGVVGCDHGTKHLAQSTLDAPVEVMSGVLDLRLARNDDTAFSLLGGVLDADARFLAIALVSGIVTFAALAFVILRWRTLVPVERFAGALVVGGAIGNFSDRLLRGHVIDFIHVQYWPVFNVADVAISFGLAVMLLPVAVRSRS
jgi:signal peptidase II